MLLAIDIGNTYMKWAFFSRPGCVQSYGLSDQLEQVLNQWSMAQTPDAIVIANVGAPQLPEKLKHYCHTKSWPDPQLVTTKDLTKLFRIGYDDPSTYGIDRALALITAKHQFSCPLILVDTGSGTTLDALDQNGQHLASLILPGLSALQKAYSLVSERLPIPTLPEISPMLPPWCHSTTAAIENGLAYSWISPINEALTAMRKDLGATAPVILTGGNANLLKNHINAPVHIEQMMVLKGLSLLAPETILFDPGQT